MLYWDVIPSDHIEFNFHIAECFSVVNTNNCSDHLRYDHCASLVSFYGLGFLSLRAVFLGGSDLRGLKTNFYAQTFLMKLVNLCPTPDLNLLLYLALKSSMSLSLGSLTNSSSWRPLYVSFFPYFCFLSYYCAGAFSAI